MTTPRRSGLVALLILASVAAPRRGHAEDAMLAIIVHPLVGGDTPTAVDVEAIFTGKRRWWSDGRPILALDLSPASPARRTFDRVVLQMSIEETARYWIDQRVREGARPLREVPEAALCVRLVARLPGAIGYVPARAVDRSVRVIGWIRGGIYLRSWSPRGTP